MNHRGEYVQKNIIVFKKKKKIRFSFSNFHCFYLILNIASFEFHILNLNDYKTFSTIFSNFSTFSTFIFFIRRLNYITSRIRKIRKMI